MTNDEQLLAYVRRLPPLERENFVRGMQWAFAFNNPTKQAEPKERRDIPAAVTPSANQSRPVAPAEQPEQEPRRELRDSFEIETPMTPENKAALRRHIVKGIWAPDLKAELVDRLILLMESHTIRAYELNAAIQDAQYKHEQFKTTQGAKGTSAVWKPVAYWAKQKYENAGVRWDKCTGAPEPPLPKEEPPELRAATPEEVAEVYRRREEQHRQESTPVRIPRSYNEAVSEWRRSQESTTN